MPEQLQVGSDHLTIRATGDVLAFDVSMDAGGGPPALHRHAPSEIYRVLDGEFTFYLEGDDGDIDCVVAGPGEVVPVPGGREHTVRNESTEAARAYVVFSPGQPMEAFVRAAAALAADGAPAHDQLMATAERHGVKITRPVPAT
jgi:mannose-6-phosphate isomerase-like protein (cupin superfamily)